MEREQTIKGDVLNKDEVELIEWLKERCATGQLELLSDHRGPGAHYRVRKCFPARAVFHRPHPKGR